ncbi:MAG TPA: peptidoglycan DD-metalloendopeptidase family protein [bacterium]|nr:peptidoglycan DD-metalloendopeptidase family protein [bacterium]
MPFFNRRFVSFLILDAVILLGLMGIFAAVNHAFVPAQKPLDPLVYGVNGTPTVGTTIPQTLAVHNPSGTIAEAVDADVINPKKLISKAVKVTVHTVQMGENYWTIAKNNNIDLNTLIGANPNMPFKAHVKQALNILSAKGVLHAVEKGEELSKIAEDYGVDLKILREANGLHWWKGIHEGDVIFIPNVKPQLMVKEWKDYFSKRGIFGDPLGHWEKINSPFGVRIDPLTGDARHHGGVDLKAKYGDPVYAAASGKVVFTGVSGGYGNLIVIAHGKGLQTYYGHLSKINVKVGQKVHRGAGIIGRVGATGRVTGPHLHFEIRKNGKAQDPLLYI